MAAQLQNVPQKQFAEAKSEPERKTAVRTMKSDIEGLFKTAKPSLIKIIGKETAVPRTRTETAGNRKKIYFAAGALATIILLAISVFLIFFFPESAKETSTKISVPPPFFAAENSRTVTADVKDRSSLLRLLEDSGREIERDETVKRIVIRVKDGPTERFASLRDFFEFYRLEPPTGFLEETIPPLMTFFYYDKGKARFGFAVRARNPERLFKYMLEWEPSLLRELAPLFFEEKPESVISPFEDRTYRNIDWRFLKLSSETDFGISYTIFPVENVFLLTMGKKSMETGISRLFDAR